MNTFKDYLGEAVEVDHSTFVNAHGKDPKGRGGWIFTRDGIQHSLDFSTHKKNEDWFEHRGTYGEAKSAAKKWATSIGYTRIHVAT